jgi:hypothetical protein
VRRLVGPAFVRLFGAAVLVVWLRGSWVRFGLLFRHRKWAWEWLWESDDVCKCEQSWWWTTVLIITMAVYLLSVVNGGCVAVDRGNQWQELWQLKAIRGPWLSNMECIIGWNAARIRLVGNG